MEKRIKSVFDIRESDERPSAEIVRHAGHSGFGSVLETDRSRATEESDDFDLEDLWDNVPV